MSNSSCSLTTVPKPPSVAATCALPITGNNTEILTSCCGTPTPYSDGQPNSPLCYQYCNATTSTVQSCISSALSNSTDENSNKALECFGAAATTTSTPKSSSAATIGRGTQRVVWAGMLVVFTGLFVG